MTHTHLIPSCIVILLDPSDKHTSLDEDRYPVFRRFTTFNDVHHLIDTGQFGRIDLHVPTTFNFNDMREHPEVYIHTYFVDNEEITIINNIEREKIRDTIRSCCAAVGEDFTERGTMDSNDHMLGEAINLAELLVQMEIDHRNALLP